MDIFKKGNVTPRQKAGIYLLIAAYLIYVVYSITSSFISGESGMGLIPLVISDIVLGGGAIFAIVQSVLAYKNSKKEDENSDGTKPAE